MSKNIKSLPNVKIFFSNIVSTIVAVGICLGFGYTYFLKPTILADFTTKREAKISSLTLKNKIIDVEAEHKSDISDIKDEIKYVRQSTEKIYQLLVSMQK